MVAAAIDRPLSAGSDVATMAPDLPQVRHAAFAQVLESVKSPDVELAVWQRCLGMEMRQWWSLLDPAQLPRLRAELSPLEVYLRLHAACDAGQTPGGRLREEFVDDMVALAYRFSQISGVPRLRLRLEVIQDNACRRLHRDCVPLRMLCTYCGLGTDWVEPEQAQAALVAPDDYSGPVQQLGTGEVAIFKGCGTNRQNHGGGLFRRSPRLDGPAPTRLVLCIDAIAPIPKVQEEITK